MRLDKLFQKRTPGQKMVEKATQEADPTTFSALPPQDPLKYVGVTPPNETGLEYDIYNDTQADESYIKLHHKQRMAATEQVVARLLKGIVNVSDVVLAPYARSGNKTYFSKVMPLDSIKKETSQDELEADLAIFEIIFGDWDHDEGNDHNTATKDGKRAYYDFDIARDYFATKKPPYELAGTHSFTTEQKVILIEKLSALKQRFSGEEGKTFIRAIIADTDKEVSELFVGQHSPPDEFQTELLERVDVLLKKLTAT